MKIEIVKLTEKNLRNAPESCKYCIYWEYPEECIGPEKEKKGEMLRKKLQWLRNTNKEFGNSGKILYVDGKPVGYAQYAPPKLLPNSANYKSKPSDDAVLISCLFIPEKKYQRLALGGRLLQSIICDLRKRGIKAVETFARKNKSENPSGPMKFYLNNGFRVYKDDKEFPLMRLEI